MATSAVFARIAIPEMLEIGYDKRFADREAHSTYWVDTSSLGLFLDLGGKDDYGDEDRNGKRWGDGRDSDNWRVRNVGVGVDLDGGVIDWRSK